MGASLLRMLLRHVYCAIVWENTLEKSSPPPPLRPCILYVRDFALALLELESFAFCIA